MDVLGDTQLAIWEFEQRGACGYIETYGILQALFLQQDAVSSIANVMKITLDEHSGLRRIRSVRNDAIGHPTNRNNDKTFHYISRSSMSKAGFSLTSYDSNTDSDTVTPISLPTLILSQNNGITLQLNEIYEQMKTLENNHRFVHKSIHLKDFFHPTASYLIGKLRGAAHNANERSTGLVYVNMLGEMISEFESEMNERDELEGNYSVEDLVKKFRLAESELGDMFPDKILTSCDAMRCELYIEYLESRFFNLRDIAAEIDDTYASKIV